LASKKKTSDEKIIFYLEQVSLENNAHQKLHTFSYGMRQRIMIAQALAQDPQLLLLDEPFSGIELSLRAKIEQHCLQFCPDRSVIYISHDHLTYEHDLDMILEYGKLRIENSLQLRKEPFDHFGTRNQT
jgi:ABC-type multidrug transport system ATPase subunit